MSVLVPKRSLLKGSLGLAPFADHLMDYGLGEAGGLRVDTAVQPSTESRQALATEATGEGGDDEEGLVCARAQSPHTKGPGGRAPCHPRHRPWAAGTQGGSSGLCCLWRQRGTPQWGGLGGRGWVVPHQAPAEGLRARLWTQQGGRCLRVQRGLFVTSPPPYLFKGSPPPYLLKGSWRKHSFHTMDATALDIR